MQNVDAWSVAVAGQFSSPQDYDCPASCLRLWLRTAAYSPSLVLSDYYLFRNLESHLRGVRY